MITFIYFNLIYRNCQGTYIYLEYMRYYNTICDTIIRYVILYAIL